LYSFQKIYGEESSSHGVGRGISFSGRTDAVDTATGALDHQASHRSPLIQQHNLINQFNGSGKPTKVSPQNTQLTLTLTLIRFIADRNGYKKL